MSSIISMITMLIGLYSTIAELQSSEVTTEYIEAYMFHYPRICCRGRGVG